MNVRNADVHARVQVWIHSNCCKGVIALVGKGGGARVQRGNAVMSNCYFEDNTARLLGGAIFVDLLGRLTMDNVTLVVDAVERHAVDGDLIYSNGNVSVISAHLHARSASDHVSVLCHSGTRWSFEATQIEVYCPVCIAPHRFFTSPLSMNHFKVTSVGNVITARTTTEQYL